MDGNLTDWQRDQIDIMIRDGIEEYDKLNTVRHKEHTDKLDAIKLLIIGVLIAIVTNLVTQFLLHKP